MNDLQALPRLLTQQVRQALAAFPVVIVTGARQTGKSTLVKAVAKESGHRYRTLDDLQILERAQEQPDALLASEERLILDEVQRSPELLLAVKRAVDRQRSVGRFLLTGSANLLLMQTIADSLAGRAVYLNLWPLTRRERLGLGQAGRWSELFAQPAEDWPQLLGEGPELAADWKEEARRGGYPTPAYELKNPEERALWFAGYARTYLERDLSDLAQVSSLVDFRRLMRAVCLRLGNLVNQTELGRDVGLSQPTVHRHLDLLEISYQLIRVPAYAVNRTKRLIKAPKLYWVDPGLALHLAGEDEPRGAHLENLVLGDLLAWRSVQLDPPEILYWRTSTGEEVDFVIEWKGRLLPLEVKASTKPRLSDARALEVFLQEYPDRSRNGLLLHGGEDTTWLTPRILAVPWWRVL